MGVMYLCNFVGGKKAKMPKALEVGNSICIWLFFNSMHLIFTLEVVNGHCKQIILPA
jgi:hypothetical protein